MKFVLKILGVLLAIWILYTVTIRCEDSIPYCIGWSAQTMFYDITRGLFQ